MHEGSRYSEVAVQFRAGNLSLVTLALLGAFCTSPFQSLYFKANEPSLNNRRIKLAIQYVVKFKTNQHHHESKLIHIWSQAASHVTSLREHSYGIGCSREKVQRLCSRHSLKAPKPRRQFPKPIFQQLWKPILHLNQFQWYLVNSSQQKVQKVGQSP